MAASSAYLRLPQLLRRVNGHWAHKAYSDNRKPVKPFFGDPLVLLEHEGHHTVHSVYWHPVDYLHRWASDRAEAGIEPESQVQLFGPARRRSFNCGPARAGSDLR